MGDIEASDNHVYMPGDVIQHLSHLENKPNLGPGIYADQDDVKVTRAGKLRKKDNVYWIESHRKRYVPARGEHVVGIVTNKMGDLFRVDIGSADQAFISFLSFEGATKRNRPDIKIGDLLYARILSASRDMEPELVCIDGNGKSSGMGLIKDDYFMFKCSLNLVSKVLRKDCPLLAALGKQLPYELAVGMNGRICVKGRSVPETITIVNAISNSEYMDNAQCVAMVNKLLDKLAGFT